MYIDDLKSYISSGDETVDSILLGALSVLSTLGLVTIGPKGLVMVTSRHAHFALGSLSKFLIASAPAIDGPLSKHPTQSIVQFTKTLETLREHASGVDNTPLHSRRIVNLLTKSQQRRGSRTEDVYLFVYRADWDQYHLVGYSQYHDDQDDEYVAQLAMQEHLGLKRDQYELDPLIKPDDVPLTLVSEPNGVLTEYTFCLKVVKKIEVPLRVSDPSKFRWFTWEEILRRRGLQGEVIMESTSQVMRGLGDLDSLPMSVTSAESVLGYEGSVTKPDGWSFWRELLPVGLVVLVSGLLIFVSFNIMSWRGISGDLLQILGSIAQILGYVLPVASIPRIIRIVRRLVRRYRLNQQDTLEQTGDS
jgi:hypothetical protein